jgi:hypothetical protein
MHGAVSAGGTLPLSAAVPGALHDKADASRMTKAAPRIGIWCLCI